jgi:peptide/nickel transport system substrate-binding protein
MTMLAAACGGGGGGGAATTEAAKKGGTLRVNTDGFAFTGGLDPTGEYWGIGWTLLEDLLTRTLVQFKHEAAPGGNELVPDLATEVPKPTDGGKTYEFHLKDGIMFGPPVNREITSKDIEYAFRRIATESLVAQYGSYYEGVIKGLKTGPAPKSISGIETPDDKTIIFHLTKETPDFLYRVAMPAASAFPEEVAGCFDAAGDYGRYVVSSGPYMIRGSEDQDASSCKTLKPLAGFNPNDHFYVDRNPKYDPSTDGYRHAYPNSVEVDLNTNPKDIFNKIEANELDTEMSSGNPPPDVLRKYATSSTLKDQLTGGEDIRTWYITINLDEPPFDDIHVRKAMNFAIDKEALLRVWGGTISGDIATHIQPPLLTGGHPTGEEYDPYPYSVSKAKAEMKQSKYDSDGDGVCDDDTCKGIVMINRNVPPWTTMEPVITDSLSKIGIDVSIRELNPDAAYTTIQTVAKRIPLGLNPGWSTDYPDEASFIGFLFNGPGILPEGNYNYALVGLTAAQAKDFGVPYVGNIPSVDSDIANCTDTATSTGSDSPETTDCWVTLDKKLMEDVVPWVPYLWPKVLVTTSDAVTHYEFSQHGGYTAWGEVALDPSKQK